MHGNIAQSMKSRSPQLDQAVSAFVEDFAGAGLEQNVLLVVVTGEFGRTPRVNRPVVPLGAAEHPGVGGGGLRMGQVIGESASKVDVPKTQPIISQDLMATVFEVWQSDEKLHFPSPGGRPR
jgi:uncharacterized protein (DUF1501 family)